MIQIWAWLISRLVFALQQLPDGREEGGAEVQVPDGRAEGDDGEQVHHHRLVAQGHRVVHGCGGEWWLGRVNVARRDGLGKEGRKKKMVETLRHPDQYWHG